MKSFIKSVDPDFVGFSVLTPIPGSRDYERLKFDKSRISELYYQSSPGKYGDIGLLKKKDHDALGYFHKFLRKWREGKPGMPI